VSRRTIFRRAARDDVRSARGWYEERRSGLGAAFVQRLEACIAQIERNPEIGLRVDGETRRAQLRRFPYVVYYELLEDDILVLAVWHGRRDPEGWQERSD
jgi:plasmid stabilization system protein ParE